MCSPSGKSIAIDGVEESLGDGLEKVLGAEIWFPQTLASTEELIRGGT